MPLDAASRSIADALIQRGKLSLAQLDEVTALSERWQMGLVEILMSRNWMAADVLYRELANHFSLPFLDRDQVLQADAALVASIGAKVLTRERMVPIGRRDGAILVATARPGPAALLTARKLFGNAVRLAVASHFDITWAIQTTFRAEQSHAAVYALAEQDPEMSASQVITPPQKLFFLALFTVTMAGIAIAPLATIITINLLLSVFYVGNFLFKGVLVWFGSGAHDRNARAIEAEARLLRDEDLPVYSVLVPMFKEPEVLPILAHALRALDYPLAKLDIKIVLEEDDAETIAAARNLGLEGVFEIIRVPASHPQTKPKACNYALHFARGDFLVIFDAEDKPEPDQLKKVVAAFRQSPDNTACIQCRLNYYNAEENWLTRMFTLDYSLWFDLMLPGLERLNIPIPLGGTSNHFRIDVLRDLFAWDPFNVTEDADLGIRLTQKGYRVGVIDSTTFEEANVSIPNWIRQRSRWIKGYMQTFLVHTRRPAHLMRTVGFAGTLGFIFFIGGTCLSGLINPIFWSIYLGWLMTGASALNGYFTPELVYLSLFNLLAGNGLLIYLSIVAPFQRGWLNLSPWGLTVVGYWVLMTIAAYKALIQLVSKPFYWEKTQHGLSRQTASELADAGAAQEVAA